MSGEIWKPVIGYEGVYEVSDKGRVRSLDRIITKSSGITARLAGRILSPETARNGYLSVQLCNGETHRLKRVHRLVAEAFIPNPYHKPSVNHVDGNKQNNRSDNLEWVTNRENRLHAHRILGVKGPRRKLSPQAVREIRTSDEPQRLIADRYGVTQMTVSKIRRNLTYREVV